MFTDRRDAGRQLAPHVTALVRSQVGDAAPVDAVVVVGLPRGGVSVAVEIGTALGVPTDVIIVRKLGLPWHRELAMGAIGEDGVRVLNDDVIARSQLTPSQIDDIEREERAELESRAARFRSARRARPMAGRMVVVVDDGLATGATARAACAVASAHGAASVVLAVPVAPADWTDRMGDAADAYVAVSTPRRFRAVGEHYRDFTAVTDDEVVALLQRERERMP